MTVTGIIAEFNPFHNGHKYLLDQAKGVKIVAMSGNFVQRGEPAIVDKWIRTQMALENGADLVVELIVVLPIYKDTLTFYLLTTAIKVELDTVNGLPASS